MGRKLQRRARKGRATCMRVDCEKLASALAERMQRVVPEGFVVLSRACFIHFQDQRSGHRSGTYGCEYAASAPSLDFLLIRVRQALDDLQTFISESTTIPWPGTHNLPTAHAHVEGDALRMWYSDGDKPLLRLDDIRLS